MFKFSFFFSFSCLLKHTKHLLFYIIKVSEFSQKIAFTSSTDFEYRFRNYILHPLDYLSRILHVHSFIQFHFLNDICHFSHFQQN